MTFGTKTMEKCSVRIDDSIKTCVGICVDLLDMMIHPVPDRILCRNSCTLHGNEVPAPIKTSPPAGVGILSASPDVGKQIQVAVDGSEADIREILP